MKLLDVIGALVLVLIVLLLLWMMLDKYIVQGTDKITEMPDKQMLCSKWMLGGCKVIDPAYNEELADAGICEPCEPEGLPEDLDEREAIMEEECGGDTGVWTKCKVICHCSD